jgi:hypothetical protein
MPVLEMRKTIAISSCGVHGFANLRNSESEKMEFDEIIGMRVLPPQVYVKLAPAAPFINGREREQFINPQQRMI